MSNCSHTPRLDRLYVSDHYSSRVGRLDRLYVSDHYSSSVILLLWVSLIIIFLLLIFTCPVHGGHHLTGILMLSCYMMSCFVTGFCCFGKNGGLQKGILSP